MCHACDERYATTLRSLTRRDVLRSLAAGGAALTLTGCKALAPPDTSDLLRVFVARRVRTMDPSNSVVEAVATLGGRITAVGSKREVLAKVGGRPEVIDLGTRTLLPGFIDPHMHSNFA